MRYAIGAAGAILTLSCAARCLAQQSDPAAANRALIGDAPNISVQQSAIGTLDVGGPGSANPKMTGENLRGNLGASSAPPAGAVMPVVPNAGIPDYSFQAPHFGTDLQSSAPGRRPPTEEIRKAADLILPRFRAALADANQQAAANPPTDGWRYRYFNGRWWYWRSNKSWAYWNGSQWRERAAGN